MTGQSLSGIIEGSCGTRCPFLACGVFEERIASPVYRKSHRLPQPWQRRGKKFRDWRPRALAFATVLTPSNKPICPFGIGDFVVAQLSQTRPGPLKAAKPKAS